MGLFHRQEQQKPSALHGLAEIRAGVSEYTVELQDEEQHLAELFTSLKTDALEALSRSLSRERIQALHRQVRHVLSIARLVGYVELEEGFTQEDAVLTHLEELFDTYPLSTLSSSADVQSAIDSLISMISSQQQLIFQHKEILLHEKQRLVEILEEAARLEEEYVHDHHLGSPIQHTLH